MSSDLSRFGVAMDSLLLRQFDEVVKDRGSTRSAVLSDLARAEVVRTLVQRPVLTVGTLTIVYDHHVRDLAERLTEMQHDLGDKVHSTMHVHLDHDRCLEVIVLRGRADVLRGAADRLIATRGVLHGKLELFPSEHDDPAHEPANAAHHDHDHDHKHGARAARGGDARAARKPKRAR